MSSKQTRLVSFEMTCDICGKKENWTGIEGVHDEGVGLSSNWITFNLVTPTRGTPMDSVDVCSRKCFMEHCSRKYNEIQR